MTFRHLAACLGVMGLVGVTSVATSAPAESSMRELQGIAALVNDDVISITDLEARTRLVMLESRIPESAEAREQVRQQVLRALIDERLQMQESGRRGITVREQDVQETIGVLERQNELPPGSLLQILSDNGIDTSTLVDQLYAALAWRQVIRQVVQPLIDVGEEEIDAYLEELRARGGSTEYELSEIYIEARTPEDVQAARQTAEQVIDALREGVPFPVLARQFSQSSTAATGGDMGRVPAGQLDRRIEEVLDQLQPGQVSLPIEVDGSFYIMALRDRRDVAAPSREDDELTLRRILLAYPGNADSPTRQRIRELADQLRPTLANCREMGRVAREVGSPEPLDLRRIRLRELPSGIRSLVADLNVGEISETMPVDEGVLMLMPCERTAAGENLPSRDDIADSLIQQRVEQRARRLMGDLRRSAFITVRLP